MNKTNNIIDDEIHVLGTTPKHDAPKRRYWLVIAIVAVATVLIAASVAGLLLYSDNNVDEKVDYMEDHIKVHDVASNHIEGSMSVSLDSINNVAFSMYNLKNPQVTLQTFAPSPQDTNLLLAVPAADYRRDNGMMVGDFVLNGEQLSRGQRKKGYFALVDNKYTIGNSETTEMRDYCKACDGNFFRQYILVWDGEAQMNQLKGKAKRRAIGQKGDEWIVVETTHRESLYDFSEALADYGFSTALHLVGGVTTMMWRENGTFHTSPSQEIGGDEHPNYLVFSR